MAPLHFFTCLSFKQGIALLRQFRHTTAFVISGKPGYFQVTCHPGPLTEWLPGSLSVNAVMLGFHKFKYVISGIVLAASLTTMGSAFARKTAPDSVAVDSLPSVALAELPPQGREVYALILQGATFPNEKDGSVFGNRERQLPAHKRGYYREYTVRTPGARNRGARRLICGGEPRVPDACYYTEDHYASFRKVVP